ncbi:DotU family type VI secretion system protein [Pusillimonas sp. MFBS29]|uniref:DotU family type VI secretion system protein n=1 Tax=Pusillimonas sp. MFBS29 TaxID=2886690 RepID=UPI001D114CBD|nr:DotU family type VI secretion system protein [Pusillimonas sp. MFBS29]MCC2596539.1 DotU family type VI secretion system protein [Pusillimonas sp. MFBS29]
MMQDGISSFSGSANALVAAANSLLVLIPQIRVTETHPSPQLLREHLLDEVRQFEMRAQQAGIQNETILGARYCLCTALDEAAALTPWGGGGVWSAHSLLVTFHNETWGGEKFFQLLAKLSQNPRQHIDLLELLYYCLLLGFEGRYRVADNGRSQLDTVRQRLLLILRDVRGEYAGALSPHWKDAPLLTQVRRLPVPLWVFASLAALVGLFAYFGMSWSLGSKSDTVYAAVSGLKPPVLPTPAPRAQQTPPVPFGQALTGFLAPEIRENLLAVRNEADRSVIILHGDGLFTSGADEIRSEYIPVLSRVADALNQAQGSILVSGYSDNVPIRTVRFPSNWELSQARADAVKNLLQSRLTQPDRVRAEGRGAADPVASNDSAAGRAKNRRVEITLLVSPVQGGTQP